MCVSLHSLMGRKSPRKKKGLVVQLVRIHACHAWGRGFESRPDRPEKASTTVEAFGFKLLAGYLAG